MKPVCSLVLICVFLLACAPAPAPNADKPKVSSPDSEYHRDIASTSQATNSSLQPLSENATAEKLTPQKSSQELPAGAPPISFKWLSDSGINFIREDDMRGQKRIFESTGGGVGAIDFDRDGWSDLIFTGGCKLPEEYQSNKPTCAIYRNMGNSKFIDCTQASLLLMPGYCQGIAIGDYDNDGFDDVYITALGHNGLFHNQGDGSFANWTEQTSVDDPRWSTSCAFADLNLDGVLDLYVVNYLDESVSEPVLCENAHSPTGLEQCPPSKFKGVNDRLFLGDGRGGFVDQTQRIGLVEKLGKGLGIVVADFDNQGLPEVYVSNDGQANFLLHFTQDDNGQLQMEEIGLNCGAALSRSGYAQASMGIAAGDFDHDGLIDLHITNFYGDSNTLYRNLGNLQFEDVTRSTGLSGPSRNVLGWGTVLVDFDFDGWLDIFVANGHVEDRTWNGRGEPFEMPAQAFRNLGNGKFEDVTDSAGTYFQTPLLGRGVCVVDLNRDGAADLAVSQQLHPVSLLINERHNRSAIKLKLVGTKSNRNAWGAKLELVNSEGKLRQLVEVMPGTSYCSANSTEVLLNPAAGDRVQIRWPSGVSQQIPTTSEVQEDTSSSYCKEIVVVELP